jgi:hypothetical protein
MERTMETARARHIKELTDARAAVERQIDILTSGRPYYGINRQVQIADVLERLRATLAELEECLAAESGADASA